MLKSLLPLAFTVGCLEKVTGEAVPLDDRFTVQATPTTTGTDTGGPAHAEHEHTTVEHKEVPPPQPFQEHEGERVTVSGSITSDVAGSVDLDVATVDDSVEGGLVREGKIILSGPGEFSITVPVGTGGMRLAGFQDLQSDGPTEDDPYAEIDVEVGTEAITGLTLALVKGARGSASGGPEHQQHEHQEMPPGHGGDQSPPPSGTPTATDPFDGIEGPRVKVSGTLVTSVDGTIDLDLFREDESAPGGRKLLGKLKRAPGPFEILVPAAIERLELDAFVDQTGDGPSGDDPRGSAKGLVVSSGPIQDVTITLVSLGEEVPKAPPDRGGTDLEEEFARTRAGGRSTAEDGEGL